MLRVLPIVAITSGVIAIATMMVMIPFTTSTQKQTNTKRDKNYGRKNYHRNLRHQIPRILPPPPKIHSRKVLLLSKPRVPNDI